MAEADSELLCSLPPNYVSIAQLQERWLKEKQREQHEKERREKQEEEKKGSPVNKAFRVDVRSGKGQRQEEEKKGSQGHKAPRVHAESSKGRKQEEEKKVSAVQEASRVDTGSGKGQKQEEEEEEEEEEKCKNPDRQNQENHQNHHSKVPVGKIQEKGKNQSGNVWREVGLIAIQPKSKGVKVTVPVVEEGVDGTKKKKRHSGKRKFRAKGEIMTVSSVGKGENELSKGKNQVNNEDGEVKEMGRPVIHRVPNSVSFTSEISRLSKNKEVEEKGRPVINRVSNSVSLESGISRLTKNEEVKEVEFVCMVEVVGENNVERQIAVQRSKVGFSVKKDRRGIAEQSIQENNVEKEVVSADVKERTNEKVRVRGASRNYGHSRRAVAGNVASVSTVGMAEEGITTVVSVGNGGKEISKVIHQLKRENKEINDVGSVNMVEVVGESNVDRKTPVQRSKVGIRGKKDSRRIVEQSRQKNSTEKEVISADVKERTNEKVSLSDGFRKDGHSGRGVTGDVANVSTIDMGEDGITTTMGMGNSGKELSKGINQLKSENKEINEVDSVYMVEVVGENKVDKEIPIQRSTVGFRGKKGSRRMMGIEVGEVGNKADSVEQSQQEYNAEEVVVSDNVKERTNEMERVKGGDGYGDKKGDVPLVVSEANMKIEHNFGNLSLSNRRYGYGSSSNRGYGDKWRYGKSRRYEPRRMPNRRDSSFVWVKKGESSDGNIAEIETQVDSSSQSTSQSPLCSQ